MMNKSKAAIVTGNMLPVLGVVVFGWEAAPAIFILWLDTLLCNVQFIVTLASVTDWSKVKSRFLSYHKPQATPAPLRFGKVIAIILSIILVPVATIMIAWVALCVVVAVIFMSFPALGIGIVLYMQLQPHYPEGVLTTVFAAPGIVIWLFVDITIRSFQIMGAALAASRWDQGESVRASAAEQYILLYNRCMVLEFLIWISLWKWMGHFGLILFLALASAFVSYVDTRENWLADLKAKGEKWRRSREAINHNDPCSHVPLNIPVKAPEWFVFNHSGTFYFAR